MSGINRDEWLAALGETLQVPDPDAVTVSEFAKMLDISGHMARLKLQRLVKEQKATVTVKDRIGADGRRIRVTAYRLTGPQGKKR
jgi:hypothetical protein